MKQPRPPASAQPDDSGVEIKFGQFALPPLRSGGFTLTARQQVTIDKAVVETFQATRRLEVQGLRYALGPDDVNSVFPPPGSQGEFGDSLPHVVFRSTTLPWQRTPQAGGRERTADEPQATWLAVLLFDENDRPPEVVASSLGALISQGTTFVPSRAYEIGETDDLPVTVIDVPIDLFNAIAPSLEDLALTASVRSVDVAQKVTVNGSAAVADYGVVVGNRLPIPGNVATAHLVSLEGWGPYLPSSQGRPSEALPAGVLTARLTTLKTWTFTALDLQQNFTGLFEALKSGALQNAYVEPPEPNAADAQVKAAFGRGYTAMDETLRNGDTTVSWYRGPLSPLGVGSSLTPPYASADQLQLYDPATGLWDVSYAAAWQLGRLMGLRDRTFAGAAYRWKLGQAESGAAALERQIIESALPVLPPYSPPDPGAAGGGDIHERLRRSIAGMVKPAAIRLMDRDAPLGSPSAFSPQRLPGPSREMLSSRAVSVSHEPEPEPVDPDRAQIIEWLTQVHMLRGVPFSYLVPDLAMLPAESIRFFQLDDNWVEALMDGAFSLGFCGVTEGARARFHPLRASAARRARSGAARRGMLGRAASPAPAAEAVSGFLLRSALVAGWPGLEVRAYADIDGTQPLDLIRFEIVAPSVMLCLIAGTCLRVDFQEPGEAIHSGVRAIASDWVKDLRYADSANGHQAGDFTGASVPVHPRATSGFGARVIPLATVASGMQSGIWADPGAQNVLTAAEFALEMTEGVQSASFTFTPGVPA